MIVEDVTGVLDDEKHYMNPHTKTVHTGKYWLKILERQRHELFYASDLESFVEVEKSKK